MRMLTFNTEPMLYSVSQVAKLIGFGRSKTYEIIQAGKIPHIVIEGRMRVTHRDLVAWIEKSRRGH